MTDANKAAGMLEKVRALLAKAASTTFPEEAELFRAKADELMTKYAIEAWEVEHAQAGANAPTKPIVRNMSMAWYYEMDNDLGGALWSMMITIADHCRCRLVHKEVSYYDKSIPVVGMPVDIDYMDMLFTHLLLQLLDTMNPYPRDGESLESALARMKEAGVKWNECFRRLLKAGHYPEGTIWNPSKMDYAGKYTRYCAAQGRERMKVAPGVYRRSFSDGFVSAIRTRLAAQREQQGQSTGTMAVALRDISLVVRDAMYEMFPSMVPHRSGCRCASCRRTGVSRQVRYDHATAGKGVVAGQQASIIGKGEKTIKRTKELS